MADPGRFSAEWIIGEQRGPVARDGASSMLTGSSAVFRRCRLNSADAILRLRHSADPPLRRMVSNGERPDSPRRPHCRAPFRRRRRCSRPSDGTMVRNAKVFGCRPLTMIPCARAVSAPGKAPRSPINYWSDLGFSTCAWRICRAAEKIDLPQNERK